MQIRQGVRREVTRRGNDQRHRFSVSVLVCCYLGVIWETLAVAGVVQVSEL
jgi:hypothetical protein